MAEIDIGQSIFEYGQTYVALSRVQSLRGLYLSDFQPQRIAANPVVHDFYKNIPDISKWILAFGMLLGRLELFAVLVLFFPSFWRE